MDERNIHFDFDFTPIGQAIKKARESRGITREQLSGIIGYVNIIPLGSHQFPASEPPGNFFLESHLRHKI